MREDLLLALADLKGLYMITQIIQRITTVNDVANIMRAIMLTGDTKLINLIEHMISNEAKQFLCEVTDMKNNETDAGAYVTSKLFDKGYVLSPGLYAYRLLNNPKTAKDIRRWIRDNQHVVRAYDRLLHNWDKHDESQVIKDLETVIMHPSFILVPVNKFIDTLVNKCFEYKYRQCLMFVGLLAYCTNHPAYNEIKSNLDSQTLSQFTDCIEFIDSVIEYAIRTTEQMQDSHQQ